MGKDILKGKKFLRMPGHFVDEASKPIEEIKRHNSLKAWFLKYGVKLTRAGTNGNYKGLCPFHDDHDPSLSVNETKGLYNCFGCGAKGDVIELVRRMDNISIREAIRKLEGKDLAAAGEPPKEKPLTITLAEEPAQAPAVTLDEAYEYYHKTLYNSPQALEYLKRRGLSNPELLARFKIGFANGSFVGMLSSDQKKAFKDLGIFREPGTEHFFNCITFPVFDEQERCVGMYGRSVDLSAKVKHLYLKGEHKGIFNRKAGKVYDEILLTEGIIDALSLFALGFQNVQALYGINGFTDEHLCTLKNDRVKTIILGFDNDEAGRKGALTYRERLLAEGFKVKAISPQGKDWNEDLLKGVETQAVREAIEQAEVFESKEQNDGFEVRKTARAIFFTIDGYTYRIEGAKELYVSDLRITLKASRDDSHYHDKLDLLSARARELLFSKLEGYFNQEPKRFEKHFERILSWFEEERDRKFAEQGKDTGEIVVTEEDKKLGMAFLTNPDMFDEYAADTEVLGFTGEEVNKLLMYIAASSRKLNDPLSMIVISESASGKSHLINTVKKLIPPEDVVFMTSLSDQALVYMASDGLLHKFLVMGEAVHSETIEHQIREMLSDKELSRTVAVKDERSGQMGSKHIWKQVIVSAVMSTTNHNLNPENVSRFFIVNTDESREQTRKIHSQQRRKYTLDRYREKTVEIPLIVRKHHAAQRLLKKRIIINSFADHLDFPDMLMRTRRDHDRFVDLIACICYLRQYQKEVKTATLPAGEAFSYIECDMEDYSLAYRIMRQVLPVTLLNFPQCAVRLYDEVREIIRGKAKREGIEVLKTTVTQREVREKSEYNQRFVKRYMQFLCEYEFLRYQGMGMRGSRRSYGLVADEPIHGIDLSMIPSPQDMAVKLQNI